MSNKSPRRKRPPPLFRGCWHLRFAEGFDAKHTAEGPVPLLVIAEAVTAPDVSRVASYGGRVEFWLDQGSDHSPIVVVVSAAGEWDGISYGCVVAAYRDERGRRLFR